MRIDRKLVLMATSAVICFTLLDLSYVGFDPRQTLALLMYQAGFFLRPNDSAIYADGIAALIGSPFAIFAASIAILLAIVAAPRRPLASASILVWISIYAYLIWRRPHLTSVGSAVLTMIFITCYLADTGRKLALVACLFVIAGIANPRQPLRHWLSLPSAVGENKLPQTELAGLLFMPDNY